MDSIEVEGCIGTGLESQRASSNEAKVKLVALNPVLFQLQSRAELQTLTILAPLWQVGELCLLSDMFHPILASRIQFPISL